MKQTVEPKIIIIAPEHDTHALVIQRVLGKDFGTEAVIWDTSHLSVNDHVTWRSHLDNGSFRLVLSGQGLQADCIKSIWWRRPSGFVSTRSFSDEKVARFCTNEYSSLFFGALAGLKIPVINSPHAEALANRKPFQLMIARELGIDIPRTLVTNDPDEVRNFWEENSKDCVYKTLTPTPGQLRETRRLTENDFCDLQNLRYAPIIVQERIRGVDLRINMIGNEVFAASVEPRLNEAETDWRLDPTCIWKEYKLHEGLESSLRLLLRELGLHYGCIDMRIDPSGRSVFFEINPSGQFLFAEIDTGQPIATAFAKLLLNSQGV